MAIDTVKVTVDGTTVDAVSNGDGTYTATLAAPNITSYNVNSGHYYPVTVVARNKAGISTTVNDNTEVLGTSLRLKVKELTAPTITFVYPSPDQHIGTASPSIEVILEDEVNGSGIAMNDVSVKVDDRWYYVNADEIEIHQISATAHKLIWALRSGSQIKALDDGGHTLHVRVRDNDGNQSDAQISFIVDTIAPTLSITSPDNDTYVPNYGVDVTGFASDSTNDRPTVTIEVNGTLRAEIIVDSNDGSFSRHVPLSAGVNNIVITAKDDAGKTTVITRRVIVDTTRPVVGSVVINPNPVNVGNSYVVTISITEE